MQHLASPEDRQQVAAEVRAAGSSFYWAMRCMPPDRRAALFGIYAFCRAVDDIADGDLAPVAKHVALDDWDARLERIFRGEARDPLERVLADGIARYDLRDADFRAVIAGMRMDADGPICGPSMEDLDLYCDRVASAVGRLCVRVFGAPEAAGRDLADHQGRALQLTNIIRDVEEDAAMGRLYLPAELLAAQGLPTDDPETVAQAAALPRIRAALAERAAAEFAAAKAALARCQADNRGDLRPAVIMMEVYERLFHKLEAGDFAAPPPRRGWRRLGDKAGKLAVALRIALGGRRWRA